MNIKKQRRIKRVRSKVRGDKARPRLSVHRSNKEIYVQLINDRVGETLATYSSKKLNKTDRKLAKMQVAEKVGEEIAKLAKKKKISKVVFDRGGYRYHGRVEAVAEGARKGGLKF